MRGDHRAHVTRREKSDRDAMVSVTWSMGSKRHIRREVKEAPWRKENPRNIHDHDIVQGQPETSTATHSSQVLRAFRVRVDVTLDRFRTLRGASTASSLSVSSGLRLVVLPACFLGDLVAASLVVGRLDLADRFPPSSSVSSSVASATSVAFSLPLPFLLLPVSASTVVLVEETEDDDRARLDLRPAAETAVDDPEENEGDRSRVRREDREAGTLLLAVSLVWPRDEPACATSSFAKG